MEKKQLCFISSLILLAEVFSLSCCLSPHQQLECMGKVRNQVQIFFSSLLLFTFALSGGLRQRVFKKSGFKNVFSFFFYMSAFMPLYNHVRKYLVDTSIDNHLLSTHHPQCTSKQMMSAGRVLRDEYHKLRASFHFINNTNPQSSTPVVLIRSM